MVRVQIRPGPTGSMCPPADVAVLGEGDRSAGPQDLPGDALGQRELVPGAAGDAEVDLLAVGAGRARRPCRSSRCGSPAGRPRAAGSVRSSGRSSNCPARSSTTPASASSWARARRRLRPTGGRPAVIAVCVRSAAASRMSCRRAAMELAVERAVEGTRGPARAAAAVRGSARCVALALTPRSSERPPPDTLTCSARCRRGRRRPPATGGVVMPIGGAEDKIGRMTVLREVVRLAGGSGRPDRGDLHRVLAG